MSEKLLLCPFCGYIDEVTIESSHSMGCSTIHCNDCGIIIQLPIPEDEMIKRWNTRYLPPENDYGTIEEKGAYLLRSNVGDASSEKGKMEMSLVNGYIPAVRSEVSGRTFILEWKDILKLAEEAGIHEEG